MSYITKELNQWAINKIEKEYKEDISLLIGHEHWKIKPDTEEVSFNFFIPCTGRGYDLSKTFIIGEIGYDLFPMSWERVEGLADLKESLTTCLMDGVILYAKSEEDRQRFEGLRQQLKEHLEDERYRYKKAVEKVSLAMDLYKNMLFTTSLGQVRKAGGYVSDFLSQALATYNGAYFKRGPEDQLGALRTLADIPDDYEDLYIGLYQSKTIEEVKDICYKMIFTVRQLLESGQPDQIEEAKKINYAELATWYEEGRYTFRRLEYYCDEKMPQQVFAWAFCFQQEFDYIKEAFSLKELDIMSLYDAEDLSILKAKLKEIEEYLLKVLQDNNVALRRYDDLEAFLDADRKEINR